MSPETTPPADIHSPPEAKPAISSKYYPIHRDLEDAMRDQSVLATLANPDGNPRARENAIKTVALQLERAGRNRTQIMALLTPCMNGEGPALQAFLDARREDGDETIVSPIIIKMPVDSEKQELAGGDRVA